MSQIGITVGIRFSRSGFAFFPLPIMGREPPPRMPLRSDWNFSSAGLINNPEGPCNNVSILWQRCLPRQQMSGPIIPRLVGLRSESPAYPAVHPGFAVMAKVLARTASRKATHASTFLADGEDHGIAEKWPTRSTHSMEKANLEEVWKNANHRTLMKMSG